MRDEHTLDSSLLVQIQQQPLVVNSHPFAAFRSQLVCEVPLGVIGSSRRFTKERDVIGRAEQSKNIRACDSDQLTTRDKVINHSESRRPGTRVFRRLVTPDAGVKRLRTEAIVCVRIEDGTDEEQDWHRRDDNRRDDYSPSHSRQRALPPNGSTLTGVDPHAEYYRSWDSCGAGPRPVQR